MSSPDPLVITVCKHGHEGWFGNECGLCESEEDMPVKQSWGWMTPEDQARHMVFDHGYDEDWLDNQGVKTKEQAVDWWTTEGRDSTDHEIDHEENIGGGGGYLHTHPLVDEREVRAAIESIQRTANK